MVANDEPGADEFEKRSFDIILFALKILIVGDISLHGLYVRNILGQTG